MSVYGFAALADSACVTCGGPADGPRAVIRDGGWAVCTTCRDAWVEEHRWLRIPPEQAHAIIDAGVEIDCGDCGALIIPGGPLRVFTNALGEIAQAFCGQCVKNYIARQRIITAKREIIDRVGKGRSKGMLTRELLAEGRHLADIRQAFEELLDEGALVQHKQIVRRATRKQQAQQEALFASGDSPGT